MAQWRPDPTFYPSPKLAMQAPAEKLAFVAMLNPRHEGRPDALREGVRRGVEPPRVGVEPDVLEHGHRGAALNVHLEVAGEDHRVRAVLLTSQLPGRFSAGLDLKDLAGKPGTAVRAVLDKLYVELTEAQHGLIDTHRQCSFPNGINQCPNRVDESGPEQK